MINPYWLAVFYAASEIAISTVLRSRSDSEATDRGSLRTIWMVVNVSMISAIFASVYLRFAYIGSEPLYWMGFVIFAAALALRWYSIAYLGKSFTVDVAVRADQRVIDSGPYRYIRHPSYTGALLAFFGLSLCFGNYVTMVLMVLPTVVVFLYRLRLEERALLAGLGAQYGDYMAHTKRLIPFLY